MATKLPMEHPKTGERVNGFSGFSWTTLFFGIIPAFLRKDIITATYIGIVFYALLTFVYNISHAFVGRDNDPGAYAVTLISGIILAIIWARSYNKYYTCNLLQKGFQFVNLHNSISAVEMMNIKITSYNFAQKKE